MIVSTADDSQALEEYENVYYNRFSNEEDMGDDPDFPRPSQL